MTSAAPLPALDQLSGLVERVTFHNADSGFCVLQLLVRGERDLVTLIGHAPSVTPGEYASASGTWVTDREHGRQFRALFVRIAPPNTLGGIERYLGSGMVKGIGPVYAGRLVEAFGTAVFDWNFYCAGALFSYVPHQLHQCLKRQCRSELNRPRVVWKASREVIQPLSCRGVFRCQLCGDGSFETRVVECWPAIGLGQQAGDCASNEARKVWTNSRMHPLGGSCREREREVRGSVLREQGVDGKLCADIYRCPASENGVRDRDRRKNCVEGRQQQFVSQDNGEILFARREGRTGPVLCVKLLWTR